MILIQTIVFKRTKFSEWESGISFKGESNINNAIMDSMGNIATYKRKPLCYKIKNIDSYFCIDLQPILDILSISLIASNKQASSSLSGDDSK